jgi:hypothetical protein
MEACQEHGPSISSFGVSEIDTENIEASGANPARWSEGSFFFNFKICYIIFDQIPWKLPEVRLLCWFFRLRNLKKEVGLCP